ncbi:MAG TPA: lytic transglycosylase domain-containing protein [Bryobacteraceae bacterium]|jgi:soluble lytic murein transglycosylase-like protein|nr:lytic transglycosylase domain-containing protein [Bryobacteraceae bacterium]
MRFCSELVLGTVVLATVILPGANGESALQNSPAPRAVSVVRSDARTGRLVRSVVVKAKLADSDSSGTDVRSMVEETAKNHDVSPFLVDSVIQVESNYNPYATSSKGAQGLMQLMPATARRFGVTNSFDAKQNIEGGVRYLKFLQDTFKDDRLAIAAYNAGEGAVSKYGDVPPYPETKSYVDKVGARYSKTKKRAEELSSAAAKAADEAKPVEEETRHLVQYLDSEGRLHLATR